MSVKDKKNSNAKDNKAAGTRNIGIDRKAAKAHPSKKNFKQIAHIAFERHEKSFEKLAAVQQ
jgi:hypothetical protein